SGPRRVRTGSGTGRDLRRSGLVRNWGVEAGPDDAMMLLPAAPECRDPPNKGAARTMAIYPEWVATDGGGATGDVTPSTGTDETTEDALDAAAQEPRPTPPAAAP